MVISDNHNYQVITDNSMFLGTSLEIKPNLSSRHKHVITTLSQPRTVGCIDMVSLLEMELSPASVNSVVATLRSDVVETLW